MLHYLTCMELIGEFMLHNKKKLGGGGGGGVILRLGVNGLVGSTCTFNLPTY